QVLVGEADHAPRHHFDARAGRGSPYQAPFDHPACHVEYAFVGVKGGGVAVEALVAYLQLEGLGVGQVEDRLPDLGEAVGGLRVGDRPGLVEPVDEGAVLVGCAALVLVAAEAKVAVGHGEDGLGVTASLRTGTLALDETP